MTTHYEEIDDKPTLGTADAGPDYMRLYVHPSVLGQEHETLPVLPTVGERPASDSESDAEEESDQRVSLPPEVMEEIEGIKSHTTLAREGLEMVASRRGGIDVNEHHKIIRADHQRRIKKIMGSLRHPHGPK